MAGSTNCSVRDRMAERRLVCEREILVQQQRIDSLLTHSRSRFETATSEAGRTIQLQEKLGNLKGELREAEDALVKALSVKTRKEAKRMAINESISDTKAKVEELKGLLEDQRNRKDEYAAIMSQQLEVLSACKEKSCENREAREQIEEAISWYNKVLGFRIECSHGVKFIFTNINRENPNEEYFFTIRHENDIYTLLNCDPPLGDTKKMINGLNKTNELFKFVRMMRMKFQESAASGISLDQSSLAISPSAPASTDHSLEETGQLQVTESHSKSRKGHVTHSPQSSSIRRSARLKARN